MKRNLKIILQQAYKTDSGNLFSEITISKYFVKCGIVLLHLLTPLGCIKGLTFIRIFQSCKYTLVFEV